MAPLAGGYDVSAVSAHPSGIERDRPGLLPQRVR